MLTPRRDRAEHRPGPLPGPNGTLGQDTPLAPAPLSPSADTELTAIAAKPFTDSSQYSLPSSPPGECTKLIVFNSKTETSKSKKAF